MRPQDGTAKQDCEFNASKRWFARVAPACAKYNPIYLGDDLYAKQCTCEMILARGENFIFTCKDSSHKTLAEYRKGVSASKHNEIKIIDGKKCAYNYSWILNLPIRDGDDALFVNWIDLTIVNSAGKTTYHSSFVTSLTPTKKNIVELIACARTRWKIENETFNVLKNNGYHLEHNYGHGHATLSSILVTFNLLAFCMHNACDAVEKQWQEARKACGPRNVFFITLWSITRFLVFPSWNSLMNTIIAPKSFPPP